MLNLSKGIKLEVYKIKASFLTFPNLENTSGTMSCHHFFLGITQKHSRREVFRKKIF